MYLAHGAAGTTAPEGTGARHRGGVSRSGEGHLGGCPEETQGLPLEETGRFPWSRELFCFWLAGGPKAGEGGEVKVFCWWDGKIVEGCIHGYAW